MKVFLFSCKSVLQNHHEKVLAHDQNIIVPSYDNEKTKEVKFDSAVEKITSGKLVDRIMWWVNAWVIFSV